MKLLRVNEHAGEFLDSAGTYVSIDKISKDDLLRLVSQTLEEHEVEFDPYDESVIKNPAHQIIYKSVSQKLIDLRGRKDTFRDESARLFLEDYDRYRNESRPESRST